MKEKKEKKVRVINKKTTLAIIASVCAVLILATITVSLVLVLGKTADVPAPYFSDFDDANDYYVRVKWNKIRGADSYSYVYWYGDPTTADESKFTVCRTQNTVTTFPRHKGTVAFKVKADIVGEKTQYSDWIYLEVSAWQLQKPIVTPISEDFQISWVESTFKADDKTYGVSGYEYNIIIDGEETISENIFVTTNSIDVKNYVVGCLKSTDKVSGYYLGEGWQDITVEVRVRAVAYVKFGGVILNNPSSPYDVLMNVYSDSDYGSASIIVTEALFNRL